ncbi:MAG: 16S rRNA (guanine(966)-N(2))-methyltransferase RsmD [Desulfobulbaceae bacterium A2]|nr:MAG: 16S rRNA (guanine(966)-N(2))-methyltransferase RsmD [Desulfobulbaceae bacterium A2]
MRIVGGVARGRRLHPPPATLAIRPSSDLLRESLGNILGPQQFQGQVLELFAGTGAVAIEALSRGATGAVLVDRDAAALRLIQKNLLLLRGLITPDCVVHLLQRDLRGGLDFLQRPELPPCYRLIFLDPPYEKNLAVATLAMVDRAKLLAPDGVVVVEERWPTELPQDCGSLQLRDTRRYGKAGLWFYCPIDTL